MMYLERLDSFLTKAETAFLLVLLSAMVILAFAQVILRNIFGSGFIWADTLVRHLVLWTGFIGAALSTSQERHISIDALTRLMSPRFKTATKVFTNLFAASVCFFLTRAAWTFLSSEKSVGDSLILSIPSWVAISIIPAGYGLITVHFLVKLVHSIVQLVDRKNDTL